MDNPEGQPVTSGIDAADEHFSGVRPQLEESLGPDPRIPTGLGQLGTEGQIDGNHRPAREPFWPASELYIEPEPRQGMLTDWMIATLVAFEGRPLTYDDLAKVLYADRYDYVEGLRLENNVKSIFGKIRNQAIVSEGRDRQLRILIIEIQQPGQAREVRLMCVPIDRSVGPKDIDESMRPSDDELRELAIKLRQEELVKQEALRAEKIANLQQRQRRRVEKQPATDPMEQASYWPSLGSKFTERVTEAVNMLYQAGGLDIPDGMDRPRMIPIRKPEALTILYEMGMISQEQVELGKLDPENLITSMLILASTDNKQIFLQEDTRPAAMAAIKQAIEDRLKEERKKVKVLQARRRKT